MMGNRTWSPHGQFSKIIGSEFGSIQKTQQISGHHREEYLENGAALSLHIFCHYRKTLVHPHWEKNLQFCSLPLKNNMMELEEVYGRATKPIKKLRPKRSIWSRGG